jgi:hypothetical protein
MQYGSPYTPSPEKSRAYEPINEQRVYRVVAWLLAGSLPKMSTTTTGFFLHIPRVGRQMMRATVCTVISEANRVYSAINKPIVTKLFRQTKPMPLITKHRSSLCF